MDRTMTTGRVSGLDAFIAEWAPRMLSVLRIVAALLLLEHGTQKLFGFPPPNPAAGGMPAPFTLIWYAAILEFAGGLLLLFGVFTRPVAFVLSGEMAFQDAGTLSGGEKTKLALAQLVAGRKNLLMLDEPTNNLDPPSRTAIAEALAGWPGSMILVSHDIEFVEALAPHRVLLMPDGTLDYWSDELLELVALA